jgi:hypothetical protein
MDKFGPVRKCAYLQWKTGTKRKRYINDNYADSFECAWQNNLRLKKEKEHASIFCSLGEWGSNVSDLLADSRYDNYSFQNKKQSEALFRYYTRLFLVIAEILTDFQDLVMHWNNCEKNEARAILSMSELPFSFTELMDFINNIAKHKIGNHLASVNNKKYHHCNHHNTYIFADSQGFIKAFNRKKIQALDIDSMQIEVIKISELVKQVLFCYEIFNQILITDTEHSKGKIKPFLKELSN